MKAHLVRAAAGAAALAAGLAGAQVYSTYPGYGYANAPSVLVRCESIDSRSNFCRADTRGGVQLHRQLSRQRCIRDRNWRVVSGGIQVDDGCRADFAVAAGFASTRGYIGTDRYGRPIYSDSARGYNSGVVTDPYGRPVYDARTGSYGNGGYTYDRYGNRVYVGGTRTTNGGYATDRYGNRIPVDPYGSRNGGYYATDRYGNRVWVPDPGYGRVYDDHDDADDIYYRNVAMGPPGYGSGTYPTPQTYGTDVIHCQPSPMGRTYCGDRTQAYKLSPDASCVLNRNYGRDGYGTWVSSGCSVRMEVSGF